MSEKTYTRAGNIFLLPRPVHLRWSNWVVFGLLKHIGAAIPSKNIYEECINLWYINYLLIKQKKIKYCHKNCSHQSLCVSAIKDKFYLDHTSDISVVLENNIVLTITFLEQPWSGLDLRFLCSTVLNQYLWPFLL